MRVKVAPGYQVNAGGKVAGPGAVVELEDEEARRLLATGVVVAVPAKK